MTNKKKTAKAVKKRSAKSEAPPMFASMLAERRKHLKWSLREVEKQSGHKISRQTVLRAEQGNAEIETVMSLAMLYKMSAAGKNGVLQAWSQHALKTVKSASA